MVVHEFFVMHPPFPVQRCFNPRYPVPEGQGVRHGISFQPTTGIVVPLWEDFRGMRRYYAHSTEDEKKSDWQPLSDVEMLYNPHSRR